MKRTSRTPTIVECINDPKLFKPFFKGKSWSNWIVLLKVIYRLPLTKKEFEVYRKFTRRSALPRSLAELFLIIGRRGGKTIITALIATYEAFFVDHSKELGPGEVGTIAVVCCDRKQSRTFMRYVQGLIDSVPMLKSMVTHQTQESIHLSNRIVIEVHTASYRSIRGYTLVLFIGDETAFWSQEGSSSPDYEILNAARPGLATIPSAKLICLSSPYARKGVLWDAYRRFFGQDNDSALVWKAATREMNRTVPQSVIDKALEEDESAGKAEYLAEFRSDLEQFVLREVIDQVVVAGRRELPPCEKIQYFGFVDPSGGSADSYTLAIAHKEMDHVIVDAVREVKPPFSPEAVTQDFCSLLKRYRIHTVRGDRYGGEWPREQFQKNGIRYLPAEKTKSDIYQSLLPLLNSGRVELLDHERLISQLTNLERRTSRGGRDSIDHPPHGRDDVINSAAGAILLAHQHRTFDPTWGRDLPVRQVPTFLREASNIRIFKHKILTN